MPESLPHRFIDVIPQPSAQLVFVLGCPRSGTTWVMDILDSHPDTALAAPEALRMQDKSEHGSKESRLFVGEAFDQLCRHFLGYYEHNRGLLLAFAIGGNLLCELADRSGKAVIVEKTPGHIYRAKELAAFFPNSKFIHVLRDGRDACLSMLKAGESWGKDWAPKSMQEAARTWSDAVSLGAPLEQALGPERWLTMKYEDLLADTHAGITSIFNFAGLPSDDSVAETVRSETEGGKKAWFEGLYRKGRSGAWKEELGADLLDEFYAVAGDHLEFAGYRR